MPPKKAGGKSVAHAVQTAGPGMMFSKDSFFLPKRGSDGGKVAVPKSGGDGRVTGSSAAVVNNSNKKAKVSEPGQSAGPGMMFSKESFFIPKRGSDGGRVALPANTAATSGPNSQTDRNGLHSQRFHQPQRRFVYDKMTGEPYAEWINEVAVCIHTGEELFRSRRYHGSDDAFGESQPPPFQPFDYSVPKQRHPNDFSISTNDILASGFISVEDFKEPNGAAIRLKDYEAFLLASQRDKAVEAGSE